MRQVYYVVIGSALEVPRTSTYELRLLLSRCFSEHQCSRFGHIWCVSNSWWAFL